MSNRIDMHNLKNEQNQDYGKEIFAWELKEYERKESSKTWNIILMVITAIILLVSILTADFLFALFIIIAVIVIIMNENKDSIIVPFRIFEDGISIGERFYEYTNFKDFAVVYIPRENIRQLYFEFKNPLKQRLSIPFYDINPIELRNTLKNFLKEDLERDHIPLSEQLGKLLGF